MKINLKIELEIDVDTKSRSYNGFHVEEVIEMVTNGFKDEIIDTMSNHKVVFLGMDYMARIEGSVK